MYKFLTTYEGFDLEIYYTAKFGRDVQDGDFEVSIDEIYPDLNHEPKNEKNIIGNFNQDELDYLCERITEEPEFYEHATEEQLERADWLRDQRKDRQ